MEVLIRHGTALQKEKWLTPLLNGTIRSAFCMTEPQVASSDATNIQTSIELDTSTNEWVINGSKWWISGAGDPNCQVYLVMGRNTNREISQEKHTRQSVVIIPKGTLGVDIIR